MITTDILSELSKAGKEHVIDKVFKMQNEQHEAAIKSVTPMFFVPKKDVETTHIAITKSKIVSMTEVSESVTLISHIDAFGNVADTYTQIPIKEVAKLI